MRFKGVRVCVRASVCVKIDGVQQDACALTSADGVTGLGLGRRVIERRSFGWDCMSGNGY